jgi:Kef-type K+ transport system membrane component KefB
VDVILQVFVIFAAAKAAGEVFVRLRLPAIVGELLVGILLGPHVLGWIHVDRATDVLAQLGIVVLLFTAGLETRVGDLVRVGAAAGTASVAGIVVTAGSAYAVLVGFGQSSRVAAIAATALAASSVGIAARAFADLGVLSARPARVVLGAAVVDDVLTLALLPLVQGVGGGASAGNVTLGIVGAVAFVAVVAVLGPRVARRHGDALLEKPRIRRSPFVLALVVCLGLAVLAERVGLAALVGAFLAGMVLAETRDEHDLERRMEPLFDFLVPFFFVVTAARMDPSALASAGVWFVVAVVGVALVGKFAGAAAGAVSLSRRDRMIVGSGMLPRAEVTLAIATAGLTRGPLPAQVFSALVAAVIVSTVLAPLLIKAAVPDALQRERPLPHIPPEASGMQGQSDGGEPDEG